MFYEEHGHSGISERKESNYELFLGLSDVNLDHQSNKIRYSFALLVEMNYYLRDLTLVLPFSFRGNLVQSYISGSKTVTTVNGKTAPTGGDSTYKRWIEEKGSFPLVCMGGTIDIFIDNIGKYVIKSYRISSSKNKSADLQSIANLNLNGRSIDVKATHEEMRNEISIGHENCRKYRFYFLQRILNIVLNGNARIGERVAEFENKHVKSCTNDGCKTLYKSLMKRKWDACKSPVVRVQGTTGPKIFAASKASIGLIAMNWRVMLVR